MKGFVIIWIWVFFIKDVRLISYMYNEGEGGGGRGGEFVCDICYSFINCIGVVFWFLFWFLMMFGLMLLMLFLYVLI